jgi:two-component system, chemotaxis family, chemotaxis protein CheY
MPTCLVVDDSSVIRKVAARILTKLDLDVADAANAGEAMERIRSGMPDILLMSATFTDAAADDFIRQFRALPGAAATVVLPMLVEANLGQMTRMKRAGANGFIYKPFNRASLSDWLAPHLAVPQAA